MRSVLILLTIGCLGTAALLLRPCQELVAVGPTFKTVQYVGINHQLMSEIRQRLQQNLAADSLANSTQKSEVENILNQLDALKKPQAMTVEFHPPETTPSKLPYFLLWGTIFISLLLQTVTVKEKSKNQVSSINQASILELEKKIINDGNDESQKRQPKDFNQIIAEITEGLNHHFQGSGKLLDIEFKKNVLECSPYESHVELICSEFILSCHNIIKDQSHLSGIHLRTDLIGQRLLLGCFIPDFANNDFAIRNDSRALLEKFWQIEKSFHDFSPEIDIKPVSIGEVGGLDITLSFENQIKKINNLKTSSHSLS